MRLMIFLSLVFFGLSSCFENPLDYRTVTGDSLNIRDDVYGDIVGQLKKGDEVRVFRQNGAWYQIGDNQWVSTDFLTESTLSGVKRRPLHSPEGDDKFLICPMKPEDKSSRVNEIEFEFEGTLYVGLDYEVGDLVKAIVMVFPPLDEGEMPRKKWGPDTLIGDSSITILPRKLFEDPAIQIDRADLIARYIGVSRYYSVAHYHSGKPPVQMDIKLGECRVDEDGEDYHQLEMSRMIHRDKILDSRKRQKEIIKNSRKI